MAAGTVKWATWLPMVAAGAVAAYAITKRQGHRPTQHGTGVIAERDSDTRRRLGGSAGIHVEEAVTVSRPPSRITGRGRARHPLARPRLSRCWAGRAR